MKSSGLEWEKQSLCNNSVPQQAVLCQDTALKSTLRTDLRDEKSTRQTIADTRRYRRGPCHECEGSGWTSLFCFPDKANLWNRMCCIGTGLAFRGFSQSNRFEEKKFKMVNAHTGLFKIENLGFMACNKLSFENAN